MQENPANVSARRVEVAFTRRTAREHAASAGRCVAGRTRSSNDRAASACGYSYFAERDTSVGVWWGPFLRVELYLSYAHTLSVGTTFIRTTFLASPHLSPRRSPPRPLRQKRTSQCCTLRETRTRVAAHAEPVRSRSERSHRRRCCRSRDSRE